MIDLLKVCAHPLVDSVLGPFRCCHRIKVLKSLSDDDKNYDFDGVEYMQE